MMLTLFLVVLSGFISLDRMLFQQTTVSRPLVVSTLVGLFAGNLETCILIGLVFELISLVELPVGTHVPVDESFGAYSLSLLAASSGISSLGGFLLASVITVGFMFVATATHTGARSLNRRVLDSSKNEEFFPSQRMVRFGLQAGFMRGVLVYNALYGLSYLLFVTLVPYVGLDMSASPYMMLTVLFLVPFLLRFLSTGESRLKYTLFAAGMVGGWLIL